MAAHIFVDESARRAYLLAVLIAEPKDLVRLRTVLRALRLPGERRLHFQAESDARRRTVLSQLARLDLDVWVYTGQGRNEQVRSACLRSLLQHRVKLDAQRLVLESRGPALDRVDRRTIFDSLRQQAQCDPRGVRVADHVSSLEYRHLQAHEEPALWVPDAVAWSYGAGGHWRKRVSPLLRVVTDLGNV